MWCRLADGGGGERLFLPAEIVEILGQLRAMGVSERTVQIERDAWILVVALSPQVVPEWVREKTSAMADPEFRSLYLACDEALGWDPADPRLAELADAITKWESPGSADHSSPDETLGNLAAVSLMTSHAASWPPAWQRLSELSGDQPRPAAAAAPGGQAG